jgi:hypothetical protein
MRRALAQQREAGFVDLPAQVIPEASCENPFGLLVAEVLLRQGKIVELPDPSLRGSGWLAFHWFPSRPAKGPPGRGGWAGV